MWRTSVGTRTLCGAEAELVRQLIGYVYYQIDMVCREARESFEIGISLFDRLQDSQQLAILAEVAEGLLDEKKDPPDLTALREATVGVLFEQLRTCVEIEMECEEMFHRPDRFWRSLILKAYAHLSKAEEIERFVDDELPTASCADYGEWNLPIECLMDNILWDRDWEMEPDLVDVSPERSSILKDTLGIGDGYFQDIAPDPNERQLAFVRERLQSLVDRRSIGFGGTN